MGNLCSNGNAVVSEPEVATPPQPPKEPKAYAAETSQEPAKFAARQEL